MWRKNINGICDILISSTKNEESSRRLVSRVRRSAAKNGERKNTCKVQREKGFHRRTSTLRFRSPFFALRPNYNLMPGRG